MQKVLDWFSQALRTFEDILAHVSSPLLAAGLAIGVIDIITGGALLVQVPWLLYGWAGTQAVGIDVMLPMMADRMVMSLVRKEWGSALFYALMTGALGYVGFLGAAAFNLQQTQHITVDQAMAELGVSPFMWVIERNALAVVLVVLSGVLRKKPEVKTVEQMNREMAEGDTRAKYDAWKRRRLVQGARAWGKTARALIAGTDVQEDEPAQQQDEGTQEGTPPIPFSAAKKKGSEQDRMRRVYVAGMSATALAKAAGVHRNTAQRFIAAQKAASA